MRLPTGWANALQKAQNHGRARAQGKVEDNSVSNSMCERNYISKQDEHEKMLNILLYSGSNTRHIQFV